MKSRRLASVTIVAILILLAGALLTSPSARDTYIEATESMVLKQANDLASSGDQIGRAHV